MPKAATPITLAQRQRDELQKLVRATSSPQHTVLRAGIVLRAEGGEDNTALTAALHIAAHTMAKWRGRLAGVRVWQD